MPQYDLIYWSVPFRGQFVRAVLSFAGLQWTEWQDDAIAALMSGPIENMPVPFMGPPVLIDRSSGFALSQMPAIILYLGEKHGLLPKAPEKRALAMKVVNDANDVIDEITLNGGQQMWTDERWAEAMPRFQKWMLLWEDLGHRHGLTRDSGYLLGEASPGIADVVTATLWTTMAERFGAIDALLGSTAPDTAALAKRISALPALAQLSQTSRQTYGDAYCGGQIGASMAKVLD